MTLDFYGLDLSDTSDDYRDLWVIDPGDADPALLGEARRLADSLGAYVHYVGAGDATTMFSFGADRVHPIETADPNVLAPALASTLNAIKPEFILLTASELGNDLALRLAHALNGSAVCDGLNLRLEESARQLIVSHPVYDGAYHLDTALVARPQIVTLQRGTLAAPMRDDSRTGEIESFDLSLGENTVETLGAADYTPPLPLLRHAARVVGIGKAGNTAESAAQARELAKTIGAQFGGDRTALEAGWINRDEVIGVNGEEIAPDLYLAFGIHSDSLHRIGVENAKRIIAIHPNARAPITAYADEVVVAEPKDVLPQLLAELKK